MSLYSEGGQDSTGQFQRYRVEDSESPSEAVVRAVSAVSDQNPLDLPVLYDTIDPDALNELLSSADTDADGSDRHCVSFRYADHYVAAERDRVLVRPTATE